MTFLSVKKTLGFLAVILIGGAQCNAGWNTGYPWGPTHNGSAYMVAGGDTMYAYKGTHNGFKYNSGASYSTTQLICTSSKPTMGAQAYCSAPTVRGTWPAFWMTSVGPWTAEVDIAEFKGSTTCWQNMYDGGWVSQGHVANNAYFKGFIWIVNKTPGYNDCRVDLSINNRVMVSGTMHNFRNKAFWLIRDLQMEGSSGSPGPASAQFTCKNISQW